MKNLKAILLKYKITIIIVFAIFFGFTIRLLTPTPSPQPSPIYPSHLTTYPDIIPGSTHIDQLTAKYGQPLPDSSPYVATTSSQSHYFPSPVDHLPTEVITSPNGTITIIKEKYTPETTHGNIKQYLDYYGPPDLELFGPWYRSGHTSYVWLKQGLIVIANPRLNSSNIMQIWRTTPLTETDFFNRFGDQFFTTEPTGPQEY